MAISLNATRMRGTEREGRRDQIARVRKCCTMVPTILEDSVKQPKDAAVNFRAPSKLVAQAHECADDWGVNVSEFIREAISLQIQVARAGSIVTKAPHGPPRL